MIETEKEYPPCTYIMDEIVRCDGCGFEIEPVVVRKMLGQIHGVSAAAVLTVATGIIHKVGGRGMPRRLLCHRCFCAPRGAPARPLVEVV